ncbi:cyclopropane fatty acyl phospholipid synthase [Candidatus Parcubacteria bacterium]|nr:cyclopropane fatty acyl phospholipid synthase [Candidatus Parcubacteria bacterium]
MLEPTGIKINGSNPWDIKIHNQGLYNKVLSEGSLGLGESYVAGWWDCEALDQFFTRLFLAQTSDQLGMKIPDLIEYAKAKVFNLQIGRRAYEVAEKHYNLGNEFFAAMIGPSLMYSCGYWKNAQTLEEAQFAKLDLICKKLNLQKGQRILEIGCGWGAFAKFAIENYGVSVVGLTVSKEQKKYAEELCKGLPMEVRLQDYHEVNEKFDHVVSIAMFEAVGVKNFRSYMEVARRCLKDGGLFVLHTIGGLEPSSPFDPWLNKYIFPNSHIPSLKEICQSVEKLFVIEDVHNFGANYDRTLMEWYKNFKATWPKFEKQYGPKFYRMWEYYLLQCAALFRARRTQLWHIVFSPHGVKGGYESIR